MTPERIMQIQRAIHAAEEAGDGDAVRVLTEGYAKIDSAGARRFQVGQAVNRAMAAGDTTGARVLTEGYQKELGEQPATATVTVEGQQTSVPVQRPEPKELTSRELGRLEGEAWSPIGSAAQGVGSMMFGLGTPAGAVARIAETALPGGEPMPSWGEAMEFSRGVREGAKEAHPKAYAAGAVYGVVQAAPKLIQGAAQAAPRVASMFALKAGQTARNVLRLSAAGAAAAGTTAAMQEGVEEVPEASAFGAVAGPVAAGVVRGAVGFFRRIAPDNAAVKLLAARLKETPAAIAARYNQLLEQFERAGIRRKPSLMEVVGTETAGEIGVVAARSPAAGRVLSEARDVAQLRAQRELPAMIETGGPTTTLPAEQAQLPPITEGTRTVVGSRVRSTETAQLSRRDVIMDKAMARIGNQRVRLSDDMLDVLEDPDVQSALEPQLRRRIRAAIDQGETIGSIDLSVRTWEMMRQALANKSGPGAGQIYSKLRDKVRDYVIERVPEYGKALEEFGRRSETAAATATARQMVTKDAREFADVLKNTSPSERVGARVGVRSWLADQLNGTPQQAERVMARLARDNRLRNNLRTALSPRELEQLETLSMRYGRQLGIIEGVKTGARVLPAGDAAKFQDAVDAARTAPGGTEGVRAGARSALVGAAAESPGKAAGVAEAMAEYHGLQDRIATALGGPEAQRLQRVGEATTRGLRNLETAAPRATEAARRAAQQAEEIKSVIGAATVAGGHTGGAFKAAWAFRVMQRLRIGEKAAKRMAELAVDTNNADKLIKRLMKAGVSSDELLRFYRDAAAAAGVVAGQ